MRNHVRTIDADFLAIEEAAVLRRSPTDAKILAIYNRADAKAAALKLSTSTVADGNFSAGSAKDVANSATHVSNRWVGETSAASLAQDDVSPTQQWFFENLGLSILKPEPTQIAVKSPKDLIQEFEQFESFKETFLDSRGNIIELLLKRNVDKEGAFIDQVTFTGAIQSLSRRAGIPIDTVALISREISSLLKDIFGWGVTSQANNSGNFFYEHCFLCAGTEKGNLYAKVHIGGQGDTFCVEVKGLGVAVALPDWNKRLYEVLSAPYFVRPKITRIDIAMDFFNGEYTPEKARQDRSNGLFNSANKIMPKGKCQGTEWEDMTGKDKSGKTYEIGTRNSVRFIRVYNKAAEQGVEGFWVRFEIEFGRKAVIPLDALKNPTSYFCGASAVTSQFSNHEPKHVETKQLKLAATIEHYLKVFKRQSGRALNFFIEWFDDLSPEQLISKLKAPHDLLPERLNPAHWSAVDAETIAFDALSVDEINGILTCGI